MVQPIFAKLYSKYINFFVNLKMLLWEAQSAETVFKEKTASSTFIIFSFF